MNWSSSEESSADSYSTLEETSTASCHAYSNVPAGIIHTISSISYSTSDLETSEESESSSENVEASNELFLERIAMEAGFAAMEERLAIQENRTIEPLGFKDKETLTINIEQ